MKTTIGLLVVLAAAAALPWLAWTESRQCAADGGAYVRGLFWFECVMVKP